jgi:stearoyl-CoA desaturase (Delta-9 desaturase)
LEVEDLVNSHADASRAPSSKQDETRTNRGAIEWRNVAVVSIVHVLALGAFAMAFSPVALAAGILSFGVRGFGITGGFHRCFTHRAFKTSRLCQFCLAVAGSSAVQGSLFVWIAIHRLHHRRSDRPGDVHSPVTDGFWWSHMGWFFRKLPPEVDMKTVADLLKFPELVFLERVYPVIPIATAVLAAALGWILENHATHLPVGPMQMLIWGFALPTVLIWHVTWSVNSFCHRFGPRRFATPDQSRNNGLIGLLGLGEGWHNNHHRYPSSARAGLYPWEIDLTYYLFLLLERAGIIWDLRKPSPETIVSGSESIAG